MKTDFLELLEKRSLFAGLTIITHGWDGHLWGFNETAAADITARLGGPSQVPEYILTIKPDPGDGHLVPSISHKSGTATPQSNTRGEIILLIDWTSEDMDEGYSLGTIAGVAANYLINTSVDGIRLAELPMHGLSISRGTGLLDEISKALGRSGIWVDQETYCDPNPIEQIGDPPPTIYDNVAFVDDYWRTDSNPDNWSTNGQSVDGAYNLRVQWLDSQANGWAMRHLLPAGYYVGTIDTHATNGGEGPIYPDWYGNTPDKPARDQTGFIYTSIVGATRPLSGVWAASGGSGSRVATGQDGRQWANVTDLTAKAGPKLDVQYIRQDRDGAATITFYLDSDRNPYNQFAKSVGSKAFEASSSIVPDSASLSLAGVSAGTYFVCAKVSDAEGHTRYAYSKAIDIAGGGPSIDAHLDSNNNLRVQGTNGNDVIKISQSPSVANRLVVNINGTSASFVQSAVNNIFVYGLDGNDLLLISNKYGAIPNTARLVGGNGNDTLISGDGNDLLFGEEGNDRLYGGAGRDRLDGGLGTDRLFGESGKDWFVNSKTIELLDFEKGDQLLIA